jgi:hypothetical protein
MHRALIRTSLLVSLAAPTLLAQTITGSITGTVTDPSGAVVANVRVSATNTATGVEFPTATNTAGIYTILFLAPGDYHVSAEAAGFRKSVVGPFKLEVNQIARVDLTLEVGDLTQSVEVTAIAPILQTEATATGDTITSTKLTSVPLNGRNFASLLTLLPGVIVTNPAVVSSSVRYSLSSSRPQVNGNREQANSFLLDGVDIAEARVNRIGYEPSVDALEEVKVVTGNGGAEFGNVGGASVIMTLKSGTNRFHGSVFEFLRNDKLDANGFFNNRGGASRRPLRDNIFGGTLGGPLRRNRAFFFMDYEGTEMRVFGPALANVAPAAWRSGDLSQLLKVNEIVRDPLTGATAGQRQPFPGNVIPPARIANPAATRLFSDASLYPLPNNPGAGALGVVSNYLGESANRVSNHQADAKIDWRASSKDTLSGHWSISRYQQFGSKMPLPVQMTTGTFVPTTSAVASWTRAFSSRWVNETRIAYTRIHMAEGMAVDWSGKLGPDGNARFGILGGQPIAGLSQIVLGDGLTAIGNSAGNIRTVENKYQAQTNFTLQRGAHLVKFGGQATRSQQNAIYAGPNGMLGAFAFYGVYSGSAYGDFLLNALYYKGRGDVTGTWGQRQWRIAAFAQDDWKLRRNLTLNLGLRWEYLSPFYEVADRELNIDIFTGRLLYPGKSEYGRALYKPYYKEFMPVVGVAWTPDAMRGNLVIRAGYRFSTCLEAIPMGGRLTQNPPYLTAYDITYDAVPGDIRSGFSDAIARRDLSSPRADPRPIYSATAWELNLRPQSSNQWNFALESRLSGSTSVSLAYVGQRATHLILMRDGNQPLPGSGPYPWAVSYDDRRPLARALPNVSSILYVESGAIMSYHALQAGARRRLSRGLEFLASYTLSKSLTDVLGLYSSCGSVASQGGSVQNSYNRRGDFGPACADARHNFAAGALYELPFGKGKRRGSSWPRAVDLALGGWNINLSAGAHSGFPVTILASGFQSLTGQSSSLITVRPNRYRALQLGNQTVEHWFGTGHTFCTSYGVDNGTCAYGLPALGSFGNAGVGTERAPAFFNLDTSLGKKFYVAEKKYVEFRGEFFNVLNQVSFGPPGRDITTPATFGLINSQIGSPRNIQLGLKYSF